MALISVKGEPNTPYSCFVNTGVIDVTVEEVFDVTILTITGQKLIIHVRDDTFITEYTGDFGKQGFNAGKTIYQMGQIMEVDE